MAIKGQREQPEWSRLPKEASGCEVWVPMPKRLFCLLGGTAIISILTANLPQTLIAPVRGFWLTNLSHPIGSGPCCFSSHYYHLSPSHALSWHLFQRSTANRNHWILNILSICYVMENTMYPAFWFRKCAPSNSEIQSIWMKWKVCSYYIVLIFPC